MSNSQPNLDDLVFFDDEAQEEYDKQLEEDQKNNTEDNTNDNEDNTSNTLDNEDSSDNSNGEHEEDNENEDSSNNYISQFNYLKELGLINVEEGYEFDGTPESLENVVTQTKQNIELVGATSIWNKLPDDFKVVLEYAIAGGTDFSKVQPFLQKEFKYEDFNLEDEDDQETIIHLHLKKTTKYDDKKINGIIKKFKIAGGLEEEAESALEDLKNLDTQEKEALIQQTQKEQLERQQRLVDSYRGFSEVVNKLEGIDNRGKEKIIQSIWTVGNYGDYQNISYFNYVDTLAKSKPEHLAQLAQLYLNYDPEKGFINSTLDNKASSKAKQDLRKTLDEFDATSGKTKTKGGNTTNIQKKNQVSEADKLAAWLKSR